MSHPSGPPKTTPKPELPNQPAPLRSRLPKVAAGIGGVIVLGGIAGVLTAKPLINQRLIPLIEAEISDRIERPVQLGSLEGLSLGGLRVGSTELPPTSTDASSASVEAIDIGVDWGALIGERTLKPSVTLINPELALVQQEDGTWLELTLPEPPAEEGPVTTEIQSIRIRNATVRAVSEIQDPEAVVPRSEVRIEGVNGAANFRNDDAQGVAFELDGQMGDGTFRIQGDGQIANQAVNATIMANNLDATRINLLLPSNLGIAAGTLNSSLDLQLQLQNLPDFSNIRTVDSDTIAALADKFIVQGTAQLQAGELRSTQLSQSISDINSTLRFQNQQVSFEETGLRLGKIQLVASGDADLRQGYNLEARLPSIAVGDLQELLQLQLPVQAEGRFDLAAQVKGDLLNPRITGALSNLDAARVDQLDIDTVTADFTLDRQAFTLNQLRVIPATGGYINGRGQVDLADLGDPGLNFTVDADLPGDELAATYGVTLPYEAVIGSVVTNGNIGGRLKNPQALLRWQLAESTYPGQGEVTLDGTTVTLTNTQFQVEDGTLTATALAQLDGGDWQANLITAEVPVNRFARQAQGLLSAEIQAAGNLRSLDPALIQVEGIAQVADAEVRLSSDTPALLPRGNWDTAFEWTGAGLRVERFTAPGVQADGFIAATILPAPAIGDVGLNVSVDEYDLAPMVGFTPAQVREQLILAGLLSFDGQILGTLSQLELVGDAQLTSLGLNNFRFQEILAGGVRYGLTSGGSIDLSSNTARITAKIPAEELLPERFEVRNQDFSLQGRTVEQRLEASLKNFPLASLELAPATLANLDTDLGILTGLLDAEFTADLADLTQPQASGALSVAQPALGDIAAKTVSAEFRYGDGLAELSRGELQLENSRYQFSGEATLPDLAFQADLQIAPGRIEDILSALQWSTLADIRRGLNADPPSGDAADLATSSASLPETSFLAQLVAFSEQLTQQRESDQTTAYIPELEALQGEFTGQIQVQGSAPTPEAITADFTIEGADWVWGTYKPANQFTVQGQYAAETLTIEPVAIQIDQARANFVGGGSLDRLDGQLTVEKVPVEAAQYWVNLPIEVGGELTMIANLGGSLRNPLLAGDVAILQPSVNQQPLQEIDLGFDYKNAHLVFEGAVDADEQRRITLTGDIPYALPKMTVQPRSDEVDVRVAIAPPSLTLINLITNDQVRWEGGTGEVLIQATGPLTNPVIRGNAAFRDGVLAVAGLSEPLTHIDGKVHFDLSEISVEQVQARLGAGQLTVDGAIPVLAQANTKQAASSSGIAVTLNQLPMDYENTVRATINGQVLVAGTALDPTVGGTVQVGNGFVQTRNLISRFSSDSTDPTAAALMVENTEKAPTANPYWQDYWQNHPERPPAAVAAPLLKPTRQAPAFLDRVQLNNLIVHLKRELLIAGAPLFNLKTAGELTLNGSLGNSFNDLQPEGVLHLDAGWVNLFSNQFHLLGSASNTITFTPEAGILNPFLDVRMQSRIRETNVTRVPPSADTFASAEVGETSDLSAVGDVQFVEVQAVAYGPLKPLLDALGPDDNATETSVGNLQETLTLTSRPSRSQDELLALISNNLVGGLAGTTVTQTLGFLGAGSIATLGSDIADQVGLQSFSVFPTTDTSTESTAGIGIGVEASFNLGQDIGINFLQVLNSGNPPKLGLEYRFTDNLEIRGSTNLSGDDEVRLEYRVRF